jgi:hypothetical protein
VEVIDELLHDLTTLPIKHVAIMEGGTQAYPNKKNKSF